MYLSWEIFFYKPRTFKIFTIYLFRYIDNTQTPKIENRLWFISILLLLVYKQQFTWDQTNLVLNSIEKVKPGPLLSFMCMFPEPNGTRFWSHNFHLQNSSILQTRMYRRGGTPWKRILIFFKYENEYHKQGSKSRWKKWGLVSFFPF